MENLKPHYKVLEIDDRRIFSYENIYFDTPELWFFTQHQNGKLNRFKARKRKYVESGYSFFEIKFKSNKSRTIKARVQGVDFDGQLDEKERSLLSQSAMPKTEQLQASMNIDFSRITFASKTLKDRATLDLRLCVSNGEHTKQFENMVIAEVKQDKASSDSAFVKALQACGVKEMRVSKYCVGILCTYSNVKYNRFKPRIRRINKLLDGTDIITL